MPYKGALDTLYRVLEEGRNRHIDNTAAKLEHNSSSSSSSNSGSNGSPFFRASGLKGYLGPWGIFFSGVGPRVTWISIGGFVFFGAYEQSKQMLFKVI